MFWFAVLIALAVAPVWFWWARSRRRDIDPLERGASLKLHDVRGQVEYRDITGPSFRSGLRKDPGSPKY